MQCRRIPHQDFRVVLQWCLQWPFLQGLAGTEAWGHGVGGEPRWLYNNLQVLEFHLCLGKAHSSFWRADCALICMGYWLWCSLPTTGSNPCGTRRISTLRAQEQQRSSLPPSWGTLHNSCFPTIPALSQCTGLPLKPGTPFRTALLCCPQRELPARALSPFQCFGMKKDLPGGRMTTHLVYAPTLPHLPKIFWPL